MIQLLTLYSIALLTAPIFSKKGNHKMVYPNSNIVEMGIGDVGITFTAQGTMSAPIGSIIFYNQKKQKITTLPDDYQIDKDSTESKRKIILRY